MDGSLQLKGLNMALQSLKGGCQTEPEIDRSVMDDWISPKSRQSRETGGKFVFLLFAGVVPAFTVTWLPNSQFASSFKARRYMREIYASGVVWTHFALAFRPLHLQSNVIYINIYSNMTKTKLIWGWSVASWLIALNSCYGNSYWITTATALTL